eukprot:3362601-Rhodomonas_salina.1
MYADDDENVRQLMEMGFSRRRVLRALDECNWDIEKATDWLLERIGDGDEPDDAQAFAMPTIASIPAVSGGGLGADSLAGAAGGGVDLTGIMQPATASAPAPAHPVPGPVAAPEMSTAPAVSLQDAFAGLLGET